MDPICIKYNELYEQGMKEGEDIRYKMKDMVSNTIPEHTYFRWGMIKRLCV